MESHHSITVLRLRAVPLRSVKSKLGRTGERELPMIFTRFCFFFRPSLRLYLFIYLFIILLFCHTQWIISRIKTIINRLINIKFKICTLLGKSDCGGEISEKPSLWEIEITPPPPLYLYLYLHWNTNDSTELYTKALNFIFNPFNNIATNCCPWCQTTSYRHYSCIWFYPC